MEKMYDYQKFSQYNHIRNIALSTHREFNTFNKLNEH